MGDPQVFEELKRDGGWELVEFVPHVAEDLHDVLAGNRSGDDAKGSVSD